MIETTSKRRIMKFLPTPYQPIPEYDAPEMVNGVLNMAEIASREITQRDLIFALLSDLGAIVGGVSGVDNENYPPAIHKRAEWFDPFCVDNVLKLPWYWQRLFLCQNQECWKLGYRYFHSPGNIMAQFPGMPVSGIFVVTRNDATPFDLTAHDLIHLGNELVHEKTHPVKAWGLEAAFLIMQEDE